MRKIFAFIGLLAVIFALSQQRGALLRATAPTEAEAGPRTQTCDESLLTSAYRDHLSHVEICGRGIVAKVLRDDTQGSRHQRFIVRLVSSQTLLIAYNIDIAPYIEGLRQGVPIEFVGEYEWNPQGGVVHWTHHDPAGHHPAGWIRYDGRQYE